MASEQRSFLTHPASVRHPSQEPAAHFEGVEGNDSDLPEQSLVKSLKPPLWAHHRGRGRQGHDGGACHEPAARENSSGLFSLAFAATAAGAGAGDTGWATRVGHESAGRVVCAHGHKVWQHHGQWGGRKRCFGWLVVCKVGSCVGSLIAFLRYFCLLWLAVWLLLFFCEHIWKLAVVVVLLDTECTAVLEREKVLSKSTGCHYVR